MIYLYDVDKYENNPNILDGWDLVHDSDDEVYTTDRALRLFKQLDVDVMNEAYKIGWSKDRERMGLFGPHPHGVYCFEVL